MTDRAPVETKNLDRYGYAELQWDRARDRLAVGAAGPGTTHFLGTTRTARHAGASRGDILTSAVSLLHAASRRRH